MAKSLTQLAAKPQLIKIVLDSAEIVEQYGEELEFYIWDRQPIANFMNIATKMSDNYSEAVNLINDLILDEEGNPVCRDGMVLPSAVMTQAIQKVIEHLGK